MSRFPSTPPGEDIGLQVALHKITSEIARQGEQAGQPRGLHSRVTGRREYAAAVLLDVAKMLARRLWR